MWKNLLRTRRGGLNVMIITYLFCKGSFRAWRNEELEIVCVGLFCVKSSISK